MILHIGALCYESGSIRYGNYTLTGTAIRVIVFKSYATAKNGKFRVVRYADHREIVAIKLVAGVSDEKHIRTKIKHVFLTAVKKKAVLSGKLVVGNVVRNRRR